jgi:PBP1b-binding outer membrane lipoprotein LpoB
MNLRTKHLVQTIAIACLALSGCAKSDQTTKQKHAQALTPEQKAAQDLKKSNDAITGIENKFGRKVEPLDLGVPKEKQDITTPPAAPK